MPQTEPSFTYRSLHGLPEVAGLGTIKEMMKPGLAVADVVDFLKRCHYSLQRLWRMLLSRITAEPVYELKMAWSRHAYLCSENITALRDRVAEMRHPPLGLEKVPHDALRLFFDEIQTAPTTPDFSAGSIASMRAPSSVSMGRSMSASARGSHCERSSSRASRKT